MSSPKFVEFASTMAPAAHAAVVRVKSQGSYPIALPVCKPRSDVPPTVWQTRQDPVVTGKRIRPESAVDPFEPRRISVRYSCDAYDVRWIASAKQQNTKVNDVLTLDVFEGIMTALEFASHRNQTVTLERIQADAQVAKDLHLPLESTNKELYQIVRLYWTEKRRANDAFPLIAEFAAWPREHSENDHLPYLSREFDVSERSLLPLPPQISDAAVMKNAVSAMQEYLSVTIEALKAVVQREKLRQKHTFAVLYELKALRSGLPTTLASPELSGALSVPRSYCVQRLIFPKKDDVASAHTESKPEALVKKE